LVLSRIYYMCPVRGLTSQKNLNLVEKVIRSLARLVLKERKFDTIYAKSQIQAQILKNDLWSTFKSFFPSNNLKPSTIGQVDINELNHHFCTVAFQNPEDYYTCHTLSHTTVPLEENFSVTKISSSEV